MTACADFENELSAFIDGELEQDRNSELLEHLNSCGGCKEVHVQFKQTSSLISQAKLAAYAKCPDIWGELSLKLPSVCETIQSDFSAYLDGELIVPAKEGVSEHLNSCQPCHLQFQDLSQVNNLLSRGLEIGDLEIDIWSQIKNRLDEDCQLIRDDLSSFYDREVTAQRHRTITSHLLECSDCRDQLAMVSQTGDMLRDSYQPEFPENFDLWPEIKTKMQVVQFSPREKRKKDAWSPRSLQLVGAVAIVVSGIVAGLTLFLNSNSVVSVKPVTAESYLIESALGEPAELAEAMVYENQ